LDDCNHIIINLCDLISLNNNPEFANEDVKKLFNTVSIPASSSSLSSSSFFHSSHIHLKYLLLSLQSLLSIISHSSSIIFSHPILRYNVRKYIIPAVLTGFH
jgi:hypothetical protein